MLKKDSGIRRESISFLIFACVFLSVAAGQESRIRVRVSLGDVSLNKVPFLIADDAGIYQKHGLDVEQFITPNAAEVVRRSGVNVPQKYIGTSGAGQAEIAIAGGSPTMVSMIARGRPLDRVILATMDNEARWKIVARPGISGLDQMKGKRLGYSTRGSVSHFIALALAERLGWVLDRDITLAGNSFSIEALKEGRIDAVVADEIMQAQAPAAGFKAILDLRPYHIAIPGSGVVASREWLQKNREAALRFLKATVEAVVLMKRDPAVSAAAMAKWFGITDPEKQREVWSQSADLPQKPYPSVVGIRKVMDFFNDPEMATHKPEDFYDDTLVQELDRSGFIDSLYRPGGKN
jgi:NitT/TauT family transport system substrate-binding protein